MFNSIASVGEILYENGTHWVCKTDTGYDIYEIGATCSTRCATIGYKDSNEGLKRAIQWCDRLAGNT